MGSYANRILTSDEKIVYEARLSLIVFVWSWLLMAFLILVIIGEAASGALEAWAGALVALLCCAGIGIYDYLVWITSEFIVTNKRVILKTGIIRRDSFEMRLEKIESIRLNQGIIGRLLDYGTVTITGTGDTSKPFAHIKSPLKFKRATEEETGRREEELRAYGNVPAAR